MNNHHVFPGMPGTLGQRPGGRQATQAPQLLLKITPAGDLDYQRKMHKNPICKQTGNLETFSVATFAGLVSKDVPVWVGGCEVHHNEEAECAELAELESWQLTWHARP